MELLRQRWQQNSVFILKTVSTKTVWWEIHNSNIYGRTVVAKPLITENNANRCKRWCDDHETWLSDDWKCIIWSDESFPTSGRVHQPRKPVILNAWFQLWNMEADLLWLGSNILEFCCPVLWMVELLPVTVDILGNQVHCMVLTMMQFFKITICSYIQPEVFSFGLRSMKMRFSIFSG